MDFLYFTRVAHNSLVTNKPVTLRFPIKLEMDWFRSKVPLSSGVAGLKLLGELDERRRCKLLGGECGGILPRRFQI